MKKRPIGAIAGAVALTIPWIALYATQSVHGLSTGWIVLSSGISVLGAAFLLAWGAETAEKDVPRAFAIAVLAVLAVAPEYAVDALFAWNAGQFAGTPRGMEAAGYAVANMTGANRILIGIGWSGIALFTIFRARRTTDTSVTRRSGLLTDAVTLDTDISLEIMFLFAATLWAFFVPLNGGIDILDLIVLVGLYATYILIILRGDIESDVEHVGIPAYLQANPKRYRILIVVSLFAYSGLIIFTAVEPFAHGLENMGKQIGVPSFFMLQWIAPLASESPELIVVAYLVSKSRSTAGFNALISSKLNQWTLLIGTLVVVYSLALGQYAPLPFNQKQAGEIWLTAAQSFFALALLSNFEISAREALGLLILFVSQVILEFLLFRNLIVLPLSSYDLLLLFSGIYIVLGSVILFARRAAVRQLIHQSATTVTSSRT